MLSNIKNISSQLENALGKFNKMRVGKQSEVIAEDQRSAQDLHAEEGTEQLIDQMNSQFQIGPADAMIPPATNRVIMITVNLSEKITENREAYLNLLNAVTNLHSQSHLILEDDFVCYNIGSPLLSAHLSSDCQKHLPNFDYYFRRYAASSFFKKA